MSLSSTLQTQTVSVSQQQPADTKPFVKCPSAMKCVPIENCDYDGIMTDQIIPRDPLRDMLRVALIVSDTLLTLKLL